MTRVLIVAESPVVRAGLASLIAASTSCEVAGQVSSPGDLAAQIANRQADVVLCDWPSCGAGLPAPLLDPESGIAIPVVAVAEGLEADGVAECLRTGVRAVLPRNAEPAQILAAIESAAAGLVVLEPLMARLLMQGARVIAREEPPLDPLTKRELEVLEMLSEGLGNKAIAWKLGISEHTVKYHVAALFDKLNAGSRTEAVAIGIRHGLVMM